MSSIACVADSKMLELHRLNNHKTINFWRFSNKLFSDFYIGDLVFFLSKEKEIIIKDEKPIVGFGRLVKIYNEDLVKMWNLFENLNGYPNFEEFKQTIEKANKNKNLPEKISSFYLEDVTYFQPIYPSECDLNISKNIESYCYVDAGSTMKILNLAKQAKDLWSLLDENSVSIEKEELICALFMAHKKVNNQANASARILLEPLVEKYGYRFIQNSDTELYKVINQALSIFMYHDENSDDEKLLQNARFYRYYLSLHYKNNLIIKFATSDNNEELDQKLNNQDSLV